MPSIAIEASELTKVYGKGNAKTYALRGVSFSIEKGEFIAIKGPSGSGKTTLLNIIGALDRPTSGKVLLDSVDISKLPSSSLAKIRNTKIGFVFQLFNLIGRMTVLENVEVPLLLRNITSGQRRRVAISLLESLGLGSRANLRPDQLSGGEQQRVAIARALATNPDIVLGDEPTGNLDSKNADAVMDILQRLNEEQGKTLVIITHSEEVARRARKIIHIRDGLIERIEVN
ncbi:MAG: ABC transporter ATP-binding protein [Nitrososphaerota archaeon]